MSNLYFFHHHLCHAIANSVLNEIDKSCKLILKSNNIFILAMIAELNPKRLRVQAN